MLTSMLCGKGDLDGNLARHHELAESGRDRGCDLVLFPEMSLTGYRPSAEVTLTETAVAELVKGTVAGPAVCFGLVEKRGNGARPYITQVVAAGGELLAVHRKEHLGEDEDADFSAGAHAGMFTVAETACSMAVCAEIGVSAPYAAGSRVVLGPSAPGLYGDRRRTDADWLRGWDWWRGSVTDDAAKLLRPDQVLAVSTQAGATDDEDFPGWAAVIGPGGTVVAELPDWREGTLVFDI